MNIEPAPSSQGRLIPALQPAHNQPVLTHPVTPPLSLPAVGNREPLTLGEVSALMEAKGFPEMELLWRAFQRSRIETNALEDSSIVKSRNRHTAPLLGHPIMVGAALAGLTIFTGYELLPSLTELGTSSLSDRLNTVLGTLNLSILGVYAATMVQRYIISPLQRVMADDLAFMLSRPSWRHCLDKSERGVAVREKLLAAGINDLWDNPAWSMDYDPVQGGFRASPGLNGCQFVHQVLREFLGYKDSDKKKFIEGPLTKYLAQGKKSVTAFIAAHGEKVRANGDNRLEEKESVELLRILRRDFVKPDTPAATHLGACVEAAEAKTYLVGPTVRAKIWQRDPWIDLTHQEEFYSSASLRGVKWMGRGPKGRLGTFGYLRNKSISALDFSNRNGRLVRARLGAAFAIDSHGVDRPVLFVDGVEGSNSVRPALVYRGLEDYATACGFHAILFNRNVHNQIPRRFVRFLRELNLPECRTSIRYADDSTREYLDAFGIPIEPFEYQRPRGMVTAYARNLKEPGLFRQAPGLLDRAKDALRMNSLWIFFGECLGYSGWSLGRAEPSLILPLAMIGTIGLATHFWYQFKSVRTSR